MIILHNLSLSLKALCALNIYYNKVYLIPPVQISYLIRSQIWKETWYVLSQHTFILISLLVKAFCLLLLSISVSTSHFLFVNCLVFITLFVSLPLLIAYANKQYPQNCAYDLRWYVWPKPFFHVQQFWSWVSIRGTLFYKMFKHLFSRPLNQLYIQNWELLCLEP